MIVTAVTRRTEPGSVFVDWSPSADGPSERVPLEASTHDATGPRRGELRLDG